MSVDQILKDQCIIALDTQDEVNLSRIVDSIHGQFSWVKVGMELFFAQGPKILDLLSHKNFKIFLDLKLHDIPQTIHNSILSLNQLPFNLLTIHLQGGNAMMQAAFDAISLNKNQAHLLGVSVLTSFDEISWTKTQAVKTPINESILRLITQENAKLLYGIVSSGQDIEIVKSNTKLKSVIPGIRWSAPAHDQARVMNPRQALKAGADHLVIGREITQAKNIELAIKSLKDHLHEKF